MCLQILIQHIYPPSHFLRRTLNEPIVLDCFNSRSDLIADISKGHLYVAGTLEGWTKTNVPHSEENEQNPMSFGYITELNLISFHKKTLSLFLSTHFLPHIFTNFTQTQSSSCQLHAKHVTDSESNSYLTI